MDLCLKYISYDPNYNYDDDENENNDENTMDQEDIDNDQK